MIEKLFLEINGAKQGMFLQSENTDNPVLLFLHGGAGSPEIAFTEKHPAGLEKNVYSLLVGTARQWNIL